MHGGFLPAVRMASVATHALRRISSEDKSPLRAPREGATSGGAVKMRASDSTSGMAHQRIPDDCAATWSRQHTAVPSYFHGSWCMKVHEGFSSTGNSPAISMRGGELWLMNYC